ncbi:unnamed protein product [Sphagnum jensenii]|uniref:Pre-mRNA polyadenylation factor Fip1 domain-containing protein n=1 Tax=Sphagnum jensenii TaxID=128206 RepID=A0ABP1AX47_9BRYO
MDDDDDFGDLYADMGAEEEARAGGNSTYRKLEGAGREYGEHADDEDDELLLYGASASSLATAKTHAAGSSVGRHPPFVAGYEVGEKDVDNEEQMLYGQLYGSSSAKPTENSAPSSIVNLEASVETVADKSRLEAVVFNRGGLKAKDISGLGVHDAQSIPFGAVASGEKRMFFTEAEPEVDVPSGELGISAPVAADSGLLRRPLNVAGSYDLVMSSGPFLEEEIGGTVGAGMGGIVGEEEDDWDSDSEDDLQIVLNDETAGFNNLERGVDGEYLEGSEDDEDLVIVAGTEPLESERDGEEDDILSEGHLPGPPRGEERGPVIKAVGSGASPGLPRIGYSGQGYHTQPHHSQYKYVRPGAVTSGMTTLNQGSVQVGAVGGRGVGSVPAWGQGRGAGAGRGDWGAGAWGNSATQKSLPSSAGPWSSAGPRGYANGMEFNLPPTKTVFDVDLDTLEDKPWRRPGADLTDYFNFGFIESSWKQYCQQLAQLRLEATMQSKIRVYESGRSEQEFDPDLPPELMAAASMQESLGDVGLSQQRLPDSTPPTGGTGRGRGVGRGRVTMPTGRAIQVEGGGGERRPSADIRRQRNRDSDAVIQIVLQDAAEDEPTASVNTYNEMYSEVDARGHDQAPPYLMVDEPHDFRPGGPAPWMEFFPHPEPWEQENMGMGMGGAPMHAMGVHAGPHMGVEGPGPFPLGSGMPMGPPGPDFGMYPGGPFGPPPVVRYYSSFRRRTPPHLTPPTHGSRPPAEWEDEPSNGSGANWTRREPRNLQGSREGESHSREYGIETRAPGGRSHSALREKSVEEASVECEPEGHNRSVSKELYADGGESDHDENDQAPKKPNVSPPQRGRQEAAQLKKVISESSEGDTGSSWELSKEPASDEVSQHQRHAVSRSRVVEHSGRAYRSSDGYQQQKSDLARQRRYEDEEKEKQYSHERGDSLGQRGKEDHAHNRRGHDEERDRHDREEEMHSRRDKARDEMYLRRDKEREWEEETRRRDKAKEYGHHRDREDSLWKRGWQDDAYRQRTDELHGHKVRADDKSGRIERSHYAGSDNDNWQTGEHDRSHGRDKGRHHDRDGSRIREETSRTDRNEDRVWDKSRHDNLRGRRREYAEDSRDSERRSGRYSCTWISLSELGCSRQNLFVTSKRQDLDTRRHGDHKSLPPKRPQDSFRKSQDNEDSHKHRKKRERPAPTEGASSADEASRDHRGRSKLERWNSRTERDSLSWVDIEDKIQSAAHDQHGQDAALTTEQVIHERQQQDQFHEKEQHTGEHNFKEDQKDRYHIAHFSKRQSAVEVGVDGSGFEGGGIVISKKENRQSEPLDLNYPLSGHKEPQQVQELPSASILEKRKERFEKLRKQAHDGVANRESDHASLVQSDTMEVKQERPARKRRWGSHNT